MLEKPTDDSTKCQIARTPMNAHILCIHTVSINARLHTCISYAYHTYMLTEHAHNALQSQAQAHHITTHKHKRPTKCATFVDSRRRRCRRWCAHTAMMLVFFVLFVVWRFSGGRNADGRFGALSVCLCCLLAAAAAAGGAAYSMCMAWPRICASECF